MPKIQIATLRALPGQEEKLSALLLAIRDYARSDKEPGCVSYDVARAGADFACIEVYGNGAAIQEHGEKNEGVAELMKAFAAGDVVDGSPVLTAYEQL
ncbi:hypothetical protein JCM6882_000148 [Rhodosporidiobolus microsporus]